MNRFYKISFFVFLLPALCMAQSNYKPGYVVTVKGDTVRGLIDYREWDLNPRTVRFKPSRDQPVKKLSARDISYFNISGMAEYQRFVGPITMDNTNPDHMIGYRDTSFRIDTVFLEVLRKGKNVAIYAYSDAIKVRYYIGENPDYNPVELGYRLYYNRDQVDNAVGRGRTVNENTYMRQLFALAEKYNVLSASLQRDIEESDYKKLYLIEIVGKINYLSKKESHKKH